MTKMKKSDWLEQARDFPTQAEAERYRLANGIEIEGEDTGELPPVSGGGALDTAAKTADGGNIDATGDTGTMGGLDLAKLDFSQIKSSPDAFFKTLVDANLAAEQRAAASAKQLYDAGRQRIMEKYAGPTQSERLFALSKAMLSPTDFPGFKGFLGNVVGALGENAQAARKAEQTREEQLFALQQQYQEGEAARLAARPKIALELASKYFDVNKPRVPRAIGTQVIGNKVVAVTQDPDNGAISTTVVGDAPNKLTPTRLVSGGQPVFTNSEGKTVFADGTPVTQFDEAPKPYTSGELRMLDNTDTAIRTGEETLRSLQDALQLSGQAYEGSLSDWRKTFGKLTGSSDPRYTATEQFDNLQLTAAIQNLRNTFGSQITDSERQALIDLQGVSKYPRDVRDGIIRRGMAVVNRLIGWNTKRRDAIIRGDYSSRGGSRAGSGNVIRYDKSGKRIK